jgi:thiol-disulfide isomerase/thioredoxin
VKIKAIVFTLIAFLAAAGGFVAAMLLSPAGNSTAPVGLVADNRSTPRAADLVGQRRPDFVLSDSGGDRVSASDFDGQALLLNFWASWCKPCVDEMPMLSRLQQDYGESQLRVLGIALDDPERAKEFALSLGLSYPVLVGQTDVVLTGRRYGNQTGMLPFSVLVDKSGTIRWTHLGSLNRNDLEIEIERLGL